jgi:hypothetical protein
MKSKIGGKLTSLYFLIVSLTSLSIAQPISGGAGTQGILPMIYEIIGVQPGSPVEILGIIATFGVMCIFSYVFFKTVFDKAGILDNFIGGHNSRNIVAILSVLFTIAGVAGANSMGMPLLSGWQGIIVMFFAFGMLAAFALVILGGPGAVVGGIGLGAGGGAAAALGGTSKGAEIAGESAESTMENLQGAQEAVGRARDRIGDDHDADEEAEELIQRALQTIENIQRQSSTELEKDREEVQDAIDNLKDALDIESGEYEEAATADKRIKRAAVFLEEAADVPKSNASWTSPTDDPSKHEALIEGRDDPPANFSHCTNAVKGATDADLEGLNNLVEVGSTNFYGLMTAEEDMEKARKKLELVSEDIERENSDEQKAFNELLDATQKLKVIHELIVDMQEILNEAEQEDQSLEQLAESHNWKDLYGKADQEMDEEQSLEEGEDKLEEEERKIESQIQEALKYINKHMKKDSDVITALEDALEGSDTILDDIADLDHYFDPVSSNDPSKWFDGDAEKALRSMSNMAQGLESILDDLRDEDQLEQKRDQQIMEEINDYMGDL